MSDNLNKAVEEILRKINQCIKLGEGVDYDYYGLQYGTDEPFSLADIGKAIREIINNEKIASYKKGYIDGGIGVINESN